MEDRVFASFYRLNTWFIAHFEPENVYAYLLSNSIPSTLGRYFVDIKQATIHYAHNFVDTSRLVKRDVPAHRNYSSYHGLDRAVQVSYREQKKVVRACNGIRRLQITPQQRQQ